MSLEKLKKIFDPLFIPFYTAMPIGIWVLTKRTLQSSTDFSLFLAPIAFLLFAGFTETFSEEVKHRVIGFIYLVSALLFLVIGMLKWLWG